MVNGQSTVVSLLGTISDPAIYQKDFLVDLSHSQRCPRLGNIRYRFTQEFSVIDVSLGAYSEVDCGDCGLNLAAPFIDKVLSP